jgi:hypothetical protein
MMEKFMNTKRALLLLIALMMLPTWVMAQTATATITVNKTWGAPSSTALSAEVQLDCNDGHDAQQSHVLSQPPGSDNSHNFVVTNFTPGMDCVVTETPAPGRFAYFEADDCVEDNGWLGPGDVISGPSNRCADINDDYDSDYWDENPLVNAPSGYEGGQCRFEEIQNGANPECNIENRLMLHRVDVEKVWIDENPSLGNPMSATGRMECNTIPSDCIRGDDQSSDSGAQSGKGNGWYMSWEGDSDWDYAFMCPQTSGSHCWVSEKIHSSDVESDTSDCVFKNGTGYPNAGIKPGDWDNECTLVNTRIYEGVPTLSQYGLGVLALLMLGVGMVGFRRFA